MPDTIKEENIDTIKNLYDNFERILLENKDNQKRLRTELVKFTLALLKMQKESAAEDIHNSFNVQFKPRFKEIITNIEKIVLNAQIKRKQWKT